MAVDLEAIRRRVQELSGQRRTSSVQLWKPEKGEYKVRALPWKSTPDGMPFIERKFYYLGENPRFLAPSQFGKPDPVNDLIRKLYSTKNPDDRELAKKLQPKMTAYMAIVVRGQEDKGIQVWGFNKFIYQRLLGFFTDEEVGDFMDPLEGFDLKVTITESAKVFNGRKMMDTVIDAARKSSPLHADPETAKKWLDEVPNIDDMYQQKTSDDVKQLLDNWLAGGATGDASADEGSHRGAAKGDDALDDLVKDVRNEVKAPVTESKTAATKPATKAKADPPKLKEPDLDDAPVAPKQSLDDAFDELMTDDE